MDKSKEFTNKCAEPEIEEEVVSTCEHVMRFKYHTGMRVDVYECIHCGEEIRKKYYEW